MAAGGKHIGKTLRPHPIENLGVTPFNLAIGTWSGIGMLRPGDSVPAVAAD